MELASGISSITSHFTVTSKLIDVQVCSPGLGGFHNVVPDWIQVQSFVFVQIRSFFFPDVNNFKHFPWKPLGFFLKDLNVIPVYSMSVVTPCHSQQRQRIGPGSSLGQPCETQQDQGDKNWTSINFDVTVKCDVILVVPRINQSL